MTVPCSLFLLTVVAEERGAKPIRNIFEKISACSIASSSALCVWGRLDRSSAEILFLPARAMGRLAFTAYAVLMSKQLEWLKGDPLRE